jgi:RNA polymerase sigma-70 factor (ECF subfamily)
MRASDFRHRRQKLSGGEDGRETELARAAASGDGDAFARLYENYEKRIYNYCLRILGGTGDAEDATQEAFLKVFGRLPELDGDRINFGAYLFTAARNASYDMIERRRRTEPVADLPEDGGHVHRERADADAEPERAAMLSAQQASVRAANDRLPARQREVLALREVEGMSYAEIADTMEMNSNSVAQLISRARTALRNELRIGVASAVAPASSDCERALPLLAMTQDGEFPDPADRAWLQTHLSACSGCRVSSEEMAEAGVSYRAWAPVAPALYLFRDTLAKAAESIGADWSAVERPAGGSTAAAGQAARPRSTRLTLTTAAATLLVAVGAAVFAGEVSDATLDPSDFPGSSVVSSPGGERNTDGGGGDGQGGAGARPGQEQASQPAGLQGESPAPPPEPSSAAEPSDPATDSGGPAPSPGGNPGGEPPSGGGGGGTPVTPPTPPTPTEPPRDPKQPDPPPADPPPTGPPVLVPVDPKTPPLNPSRPPRLPTP